MRNTARHRHAFAALAVLAVTSAAPAQDDPSQLLDEFIHYTNVAKPDLASAYLEQLLASAVTDAELAGLVDDADGTRKRLEEALGRAHRVPELEGVAAELDRRLQEGRLDLARDPQRIEGAIAMLTGTVRQRQHARAMLTQAGEDAVPRLLAVITEGHDERLRSAAADKLVAIGRQSVIPMCEALSQLEARPQDFVCRILVEIGQPEAAPALLELAMDDAAAADTREIALASFRRIGGQHQDLSVLYENLGRQYFDEHESLVAFPYEATNNAWSYDPISGLEATPVPTPIFCEVMAMRATARALKVDPGNRAALGLFIAADLKRENDLPPGAGDPIYGENPYTPAFYATIFGPQLCLDVLAIGLDRLDTPLIRDAIAALSKTTGAAMLSGTGRQPLLEALRYPDRRVQYEAALTLGRALPVQRFPGDVMVVPLLASAVRTGDQVFAVIVADDDENLRLDAKRLEGLGFTIVASGRTLETVEAGLGDAAGIDIALVHTSGAESTTSAVQGIRQAPRTAAAPVLVVAATEDVPQLNQAFRDDFRVKLVRARVTDEQFSEALEEVMLRAAGGRMTEAEAEAYAIEAIMTLRDIAISGNTAYTIADAESALIGALETRQGAMRLMVADILALEDSARAQRVLFDAALAASETEQIDLLDRVSDSVKRFGSRAEQHHVDSQLQLITTSGGAQAEAASRLYGALNLPPETAIPLVP